MNFDFEMTGLAGGVARMLAGIHAPRGKLETVNRRASVSFGWCFWMLHGNRVLASAGRTTEHDYVTPRAWYARPYGL